MDKPHGMRRDAFEVWLLACKNAEVNPDRITHTLDTPLHHVAASANTHMKSGDFEGEVYTAAFDIGLYDLDGATINRLEMELYKVGIIGWWRRLPYWHGKEHGHFLFVRCALNESQRDQAHDWFASRDGLVNHMIEAHAPVVQQTINQLRADFLAHNPASG